MLARASSCLQPAALDSAVASSSVSAFRMTYRFATASPCGVSGTRSPRRTDRARGSGARDVTGVVGLSVDGASIVSMANDDEPVDVPARHSRVDPWVISSDTDAEIAFLTTVFEGKETPGSRMLGPDGRIGHVEVELGDAVIMLFDAQPDWPPTPAHLRTYVASTQDTFDRALAAGARAVPGQPSLPSASGWRGCVIRKGTCGGSTSVSRMSRSRNSPNASPIPPLNRP